MKNKLFLLRIVLSSLLGLIVFTYLLLMLPFVQNGLSKWITSRMAKQWQTEVSVGHVGFSLFNSIDIENFLIRDQQRDSLVFAHRLKLRVSDVLFSNAPQLKYIGIDGGKIHLKRDSVQWNYQFITNQFTDTSRSNKQWTLHQLDFSNFEFIQEDNWIGQKTIFSSKNVVANIQSMHGGNIELDKVMVNKPFYLIGNYDGKRPHTPSKIVHRKKGEMYFNSGHIAIHANEVKIQNGQFWIENGFEKPTPYFDGFHIRMHQLNAHIQHFSFVEDTIKGDVKLNVQERSGLHLKHLNTAFRMTPEIMELGKLYLQTNNSVLGPYYAMEYKDFTEDFSDYINKVVMNVQFVNAQVHTDDIAFFAPAMKGIHKKINASFSARGTVDHFEAPHIAATSDNSFVKGRFSMKGIPDMRNTQIDFSEVQLKTNIKDISHWIPSIKTIQEGPLQTLGDLTLKGNFKGTIYDFVTQAELQSNIGQATTEIRLQFPENAEPSYAGSLSTQHLNAGKLFNINNLGTLNFKGKIAGTSFVLNKMKTNIEGDFDSVAFNQYTYHHINANGTLQKKAFNGILKIKDPNVDFLSHVEIDLSKPLPQFNVVGDLTHANLGATHWSNAPIELTGLLDMNFEGNKIDNFIGFAKFFNGKLKRNNQNVSFDSLVLQSSIVNKQKKITLSNDAIQASINGNFDINHLPASVQYFMQAYLPTYIPAPKNTPTNQQFEFAIQTNYIEPYIRIFNNSLSGFNNIKISGALNTDKKFINARANVPFAQWDEYNIKNGMIAGIGNKDSLQININAKSFNLSDSFALSQPALIINTKNDISRVSFNATSASILNKLALYCQVNTFNDGLSVQWKPSYFILNQKKWDIQNNGLVSIRRNNTFAKNFVLSQGIQSITLGANSSSKNGLSLQLKNIIVGDLTKIFFSYPSLEGVTNGQIEFDNILDHVTMQSNLNIDQFSFNNEMLGFTKAHAGYNAATGIVPFDFTIPNNEYHLEAEGKYNIKDSSNPLDATLYLKHSNFGLVQQFIGGILTNIDGKADGKIHFGGRIENPYLLGSATLQKTSFVVDYTKVKYFIDTATIRFTNEGLDFGTVQLKDKLMRAAQFKGKIFNQGFKHLDYDMEISSNQIELLNMDKADNSYFYGKAVGKALMTIKGPEENIKMDIKADVNDTSHIYLPNSTSKSIGGPEFIVFKKYGTAAVKSADLPSFNLVVDLDITANNKTQIDLIFDEVTGDVLKAKGNGRIKMRAGNIEPFTIRGKYNIESGKYDFNFQSFIKKPFELIPEAGNYIEWTGNPYEADLHVDARYTAERVSLNELVGNANFSNAVRTYRGSVYVVAALRNKLSKPDIKFSLAFPQGNPISSDNEFSQFISRLERDDNEILKQVSFLIVFNAFAPSSYVSSNTSNVYNVTTIGINTISQLLSKEVNKSISELLSKVTGDKSLHFDVGSSVYNSGNLLDPTGGGIAINANKIDRQRVNLKLGRSFLDDKIIVNIGGDLDFNIRNSTTIQNGNFQWLPDINVEFILTRNRKLRAIVFNRNNLDINGTSLGRRNRQGISISYRKDFEDFIF